MSSDATSAPKRRSIFDRAPKPMSAKQALEKALEEEKKDAARKKAVALAAAAKAKAEASARKAAASVPKPAAPQATTPAPRPAPRRPAVSGRIDAATLVAERIPGASVTSTKPVENPDAFQAVWTSHRVRGATGGDLPLLIAADVLMDAAGRLPVGGLHAAEITLDGTPMAVFVDVEQGVILAALPQPALYLAGL